MSNKPQLQITYQLSTPQSTKGITIGNKTYRYFIFTDVSQIELQSNQSNPIIHFSYVLSQLPNDNHNENYNKLISHIKEVLVDELDIDNKLLLQPKNVIWSIGDWIEDLGLIPNYYLGFKDGEYDVEITSPKCSGKIKVINNILQIWELDDIIKETDETIYIDSVEFKDNHIRFTTDI